MHRSADELMEPGFGCGRPHVIEIWRYEKDRGIDRIKFPQNASELLKNKTTLLWVDAENPTPEELEWIKEAFGVHPIAMEDYDTPQERARIDRYPNLYSIVFYALEVDAECRIKERPLTLFVGPQFLVTLHAEPFPEIKEARQLWDRNEKDMPCEIGVAMYALLDTLVDDYFPLIDRLADEVEDVEDHVLQEGHPTNLDRIFHLKRQLLYLRRAVAPERDVMNVLLRRELPIFSESTLIYIQDIYDHIVRVLDGLDTHRDLLSGASRSS
jgi:magnesium transporter